MDTPSPTQFGPFSVDIRERVLTRDGELVSLTPKAFDLLVALVAQPGRLLSKDELLQTVWPGTFVEESNLSYNVFALRKALGDTAENGQYIQTVPKRGYRFIGVVTQALPVSSVATATDDAAESSLRSRPWALAAAGFSAGIVLAGLLFLSTRQPSPSRLPIRAEVAPGVQLSEASPFALSPDGHQLVFAGSDIDGIKRLWLRSLDDTSARPLPGTEAAVGGLVPPMFWSPDSRSIAFTAPGQLKRIDVQGGAPRTLCDTPTLAIGGSWNRDDVIVLGQPASGLLRCSAADGRVAELTRIDSRNGESAHVFPWFLPDNRHFLYLMVSRDMPERSGVFLGSLDDDPATPRPPRLLATGFGAQYVRREGASSGHVVFLQDGTLFAQAFDERSLRLQGDPVSLAGPVGSFLDGGFFAIAENDVIAFRPPDRTYQMTWLDARGTRMGVVGDPGLYRGVAMSPDGSRVASAKQVFSPNIDQDIWWFDVSRATTGRVTSEPLLEDLPVWSADGLRLIFTTNGGIGSIFEQDVSGSEPPRLLVKEPQHLIPTSASADGRFLLYTAENAGPARGDIWVLPLSNPAGRFAFVQRELDQGDGQFSPDGHSVAYVSNESGRAEVMVRPFTYPLPATQGGEGQPVILSTHGGAAPRWRADGKALYFIAADGTIMVAEVRSRPALSLGVPRPLFQIARSHGEWAVTPDGSRFLVALPAGADASAPFTMLWNHLGAVQSESKR